MRLKDYLDQTNTRTPEQTSADREELRRREEEGLKREIAVQKRFPGISAEAASYIAELEEK